MKPTIVLSLALLTAPLWAADNAADEVKAAAKKLAEAPNYSWTTTTKVPDDSRFKPGPTEGKTEKDGCSWVSSSFGERKFESLIKNGNALSKTEDGWKTSEEIRAARESGGDSAEQGGRDRRRGGGGFGSMARSFKTPAAQAEDLADKSKELKKDGDAFSGDLTEAAIKEMLSFGRRRPDSGEGPPAPTETKGSVKFWIKEGTLSKMEIHVEGIMKFGDTERKIDRTSTTEIKDVCTTKLDVPEEAKKKLEALPAEKPAEQPAEKPAGEKSEKSGIKEA
ncbi:MAG: hypothetical protein KA004_07280 [Verrucomicrobiales bacterium]|nr:hypothetical protein [Verrucomicrobiales bacterium]